MKCNVCVFSSRNSTIELLSYNQFEPPCIHLKMQTTIFIGQKKAVLSLLLFLKPITYVEYGLKMLIYYLQNTFLSID